MTWFDYVLANQRFGDSEVGHLFNRKADVNDYINFDSLCNQRSLDDCQLSNILTNYVTAITSDGFLLYSQRTEKVASHKNMLISAVSENFHVEHDGPFGSTANLAPFYAAARGIEEELSPLLRPKRPSEAILLLGLEFHFQGYHPGLLYLTCLPFTRAEVLTACGERPGKDFHEGSVRFVTLASEGELRTKLSSSNWFHAGKASIIRSLEYLTDSAERQRKSIHAVAADLAARW
jgi:hypothetical protein